MQPSANTSFQDGVVEPADAILASLENAPESEHLEMLVTFVRRHVARVLRRSAQADIPRDQRLMDLGLDSLMALELRNRLGRALQLAHDLPATLMFDYPSVGDIAQYLLKQLRPNQATASNTKGQELGKMAGKSVVQASGRMTAAMLDLLSDADVERLLTDKLGRM